MKLSKRVMVLMATSLCVCGVAFLTWRTVNRLVSPAGPQVRDLAAAGRQHFAKFTVQPLRTLDDEGLMKLLSQGKTDASGKHSDAELRDLAAATAEFIRLRFLQDSPAVYREWRTQKGYKQRPAEILKAVGIAYNWAVWTNQRGKEPSYVDLTDLMDGSFEASLNGLDGKARPVNISTDAEAFAINFYREDRGHPAPMLKGIMGAELWLGNVAASPLPLWEPPHSRKALLSDPGWMRCADVGVILEGATGSRFPWVFTWIQDPVDHRWYLFWVTIQNYDGDLPMIVY